MKIKFPKPKFKLLRKIISPFKKAGVIILNVLFLVRERVEKSIRLQLMTAFIICLTSAMIVAIITGSFFAKVNRQPVIDYTGGAETIDWYARHIVERLNKFEWYQQEELISDEEDSGIMQDESSNAMSWENYIEEVLNQKGREVKTFIADMDGNVLYKSENTTENKVDLHNIIRNAMNTRIDSYSLNERAEFISFYPITLNDVRAYVIASGVPEAEITYYNGSSGFIPAILGFATFILLFYFLTQKKMQYIEELAGGLLEISEGNLDYRIADKSQDELGSLANNINSMAEALKTKIEEERKAEMLKNELITNVSHDLRTPLTSIIGYLNLLKDGKYDTEEEAKQYLEIAYGKSEKLKYLVQDLFEYTKLTNGVVELSLDKVNLNDVIEQLTEELVPILEEKHLRFKKELSKEKAIVLADISSIVRVFENLLANAIRYSSENEEIMIKTTIDESFVTVCFENKGEVIDPEDLDRIFDRFFKVEKSRTSNSTGSGLGLAICKNIINLHKGSIWADCEGDIVRFFIKLNKQTSNIEWNFNAFN